MDDNDRLFELFEYIKGIEMDESDYADGSFDDEEDLLGSFRWAVMTIHNMAEDRINNLLTYFLTGKWFPDLGAVAQKNLAKKRAVFNRMEFYNKLKCLEDAGYINGKTTNKILMINNVRNWFSHPSAYKEKINEYRKKHKILEDLEKIIDAFYEIPDYP